MNITSYFGETLAESIGITKNQASGLILQCIKDAGKESDDLSFEDLYAIFKNELKIRLERLSFDNVTAVVNNMIDELVKSRSLFTMSKI